MTKLQLVLGLLGLVKGLLSYLASLNGAEAVRAKIVLAALEAQNQRINNALTARDDALSALDTTGVSDDTHFRD